MQHNIQRTPDTIRHTYAAQKFKRTTDTIRHTYLLIIHILLEVNKINHTHKKTGKMPQARFRCVGTSSKSAWEVQTGQAHGRGTSLVQRRQTTTNQSTHSCCPANGGKLLPARISFSVFCRLVTFPPLPTCRTQLLAMERY